MWLDGIAHKARIERFLKVLFQLKLINKKEEIALYWFMRTQWEYTAQVE